MARPLSAFAARKAVQAERANANSVAEPPEIIDNIPEQEEYADIIGRPKKRRRTQETIVPRRKDSSISRRGPRSASVSNQNALQSSIPANSAPPEERLGRAGPDSFDKIDEGISTECEEDGSTNSDIETSTQALTGVRKLCGFLPSGNNVLSESDMDWTVRIGGKDTLVFVGQYDIWVRKGAVSIYGAVLHASSKLHRVYAPSTHALPVIRPVINPYGLHGQSAEITIKSCSSRIRRLEDISPKFARIWCKSPSPEPGNESEIDKSKRSFALMCSSIDDPYERPLYALEPPPDWQALISRLLSRESSGTRLVVLICGPKGSGKSTFGRMVTNGLLAKAWGQSDLGGLEPAKTPYPSLLDLDPGQPEYGLPGQISYAGLHGYNLGVPFTHPEIRIAPHQPKVGGLAQHYCFGSLSPRDYPSHYLDCALAAFRRHDAVHRTDPNKPLVINCSGWVQGSGLELLAELIRQMRVTDVVYMSDSGPENAIDTLSQACASKAATLHTLSSQPSQATTKTAKELRTMQTMSYFHLAQPEADFLRWNGKSLTEIPPLVVNYSGLKQGIFTTMILGDEQNPEYLESILDGSVVDVVEAGLDRDFFPWDSSVNSTYTDIHAPVTFQTGDLQAEAVESQKELIGDTPHHLYHPAIRRSPMGIPYLIAKDHVVHPLPAKDSRSIGQVIIRSIDTRNQAFHLLTPHPELFKQDHRTRYILVCGKLDTPTWAYEESLELEKSRRRRRERVAGVKEEIKEDEVRALAERTPWAGVMEGSRGKGSKKRSGRRDLRYRSQAEGE